MKARLLRITPRLRESYWFVPTIMALGALLLALAMIYIDSHFGSEWMDGLPWLYAARPDGARSLLSSIGGSMIGVAGTTFSVTIAAVVGGRRRSYMRRANMGRDCSATSCPIAAIR